MTMEKKGMTLLAALQNSTLYEEIVYLFWKKKENLNST